MFTGIIEEIGQIICVSQSASGAVLRIGAKKIMEDCHVGDSISVNGVCLTVRSFEKNSFCADVMPETLRKSNLGDLENGSRVNLERAMKTDGRFGGHFVSGHIDGTGTISGVLEEGNAVWINIQTNPEILNLIVLKGSVAIDGISLTVAKLTEKSFEVSVIPHTAQKTTLLNKKKGERVNLENDIIGKYVARFNCCNENLKKIESCERQKERDQLFIDFLQN